MYRMKDRRKRKRNPVRSPAKYVAGFKWDFRAGKFRTKKERTQLAVDSILEGYRSQEEAIENYRELKDRPLIAYDAAGASITPRMLKWAIEMTGGSV